VVGALSLESRIVLIVVRIYVYVRYWRLVKRFVSRIGFFPDPALPYQSVEKYLWRKLFDHDPRFIELSDKLQVKDFVQARFPEINVPRTLWQGDDPADIPDELLKTDCVIKANHGCEMNWFNRAGSADRPAMEKQCSKWLKKRHGARHYEWGYLGIKPKIFVEEMLFSGSEQVNRDYKLYMCGDVLNYCYVCLDRFGEETTHAVLDPDGNAQVMEILMANLSVPMPKPDHWDELVTTAKRLGHEFDHVRCDLFEIDGAIWFSELTFYPMAGYEWFEWPEVQQNFAELWDIKRSWFLTTSHTGWKKRYANALLEALSN